MKTFMVRTVVLFLVILLSGSAIGAKWAAQIRSRNGQEDSAAIARNVANELKLLFHGPVGSLADTFVFSDLLGDGGVDGSHNEQQRETRNAEDAAEEEVFHSALQSHQDVLWHSEQKPLKRVKRGYFSDPSFTDQWFLVNEKDEGRDHNVTGVWEQNITGRGVVISIVDDGLELDHPDLAQSYNADGSTDLNGNDRDPSPRYDRKDTNHHGTRCAGEIAAHPNNSVCGVGISYGAQVSATRILDGDVSDSMEASAFGFAPNVNSIYSCSWGPDDDGKTVDGPRPLAKRALEHGIKYGRHGYGSIYVVASGNGGRHEDNCNFDGYANSIYTMTIAGIGENNRNPPYNELCAATMAVAYSSAGHSKTLRAVTTTDLHHSCTDHHTGTSAAAPLAAGLMALMLEVRPCLTWRDIQHLVMMSAVKVDSGATWQENGAGLSHSYEHGFGLMTAWRLVQSAKIWPLVPTMSSWKSTKVIVNKHTKNVARKTVRSSVTVDVVPGIVTLEHVQVTVWISIKRRGALQIVLTSPNGTESLLATPRAPDMRTHGLKEWNFSTVRCWGETPQGEWDLRVQDTDTTNQHGFVHEWRLTLHGTEQTPGDVQRRRRLIHYASQRDGPSPDQVLSCSGDRQLSGLQGSTHTTRIRATPVYPLVVFFLVLTACTVAFLVYFILACGGPLLRWMRFEVQPAIGKMTGVIPSNAGTNSWVTAVGDERGSYCRLTNAEEGVASYGDSWGLDSFLPLQKTRSPHSEVRVEKMLASIRDDSHGPPSHDVPVESAFAEVHLTPVKG